MTLVKDNKADFIQDHQNRCRDHGNGIWQWGREIGLNSEHSMGKWELMAKSRTGKTPRAVDGKLLEETSGVRGILAKLT